MFSTRHRHLFSIMNVDNPVTSNGSLQRKREPHAEDDAPLRTKQRRVVIGTTQMTLVWSSYTAHFSEYCKGRQKVVQKVPSKVWRSVWADFVLFMNQRASDNGLPFDEADLPAQRTVQDQLRSALDEQETGTSDEKGDVATLQNEDVLQRLKRSDVYAKMKMGEFRDKLAKKPSSSSAAESNSSGGRETRNDIIARTADAINRMTDIVHRSSVSVTQAMCDQFQLLREGLVVKKLALDLKKESHELLKNSHHLKMSLHDEDITDKNFKRILLLRDSRVISDEEYKKKAAELVGI